MNFEEICEKHAFTLHELYEAKLDQDRRWIKIWDDLDKFIIEDGTISYTTSLGDCVKYIRTSSHVKEITINGW
jgi:hypothetical protein